MLLTSRQFAHKIALITQTSIKKNAKHYKDLEVKCKSFRRPFKA